MTLVFLKLFEPPAAAWELIWKIKSIFYERDHISVACKIYHALGITLRGKVAVKIPP